MDSNAKVLIVGGTGFIGNELGIELVKAGFQINLLTRKVLKKPAISYPAKQYEWQADGSIPTEAIAGVQAVINLAGESISTGRWTAQKKRRIIDSRVQAVTQVVAAVNKHRVGVLIQASAIGYYGETDESGVDESGNPGSGFLAETSQAWEAPLQPLDSSVRKVVMRIGVVLGTTGGALPEILNPYVAGAGATIGSGRQYMSWIHIRDVCGFVLNALKKPDVQGVYNLVAPSPTTYQGLHSTLEKYFGGLGPLKVPAVFLKLALGKKSQILLISQKILPLRMLESGFKFQFTELDSCLRDLLGDVHSDCAVLHTKQWVSEGPAKVWEFFSDEKNLEELTPPFLHFHVENVSPGPIAVHGEGTEIRYRLKIHGLPFKWKSKIVNYDPPRSFQDVQLKGPYKVWHHTHNFVPLGSGTLIEDMVKFKVPLGFIGGMTGHLFVKNDVDKIFGFRRKKIAELFNR